MYIKTQKYLLWIFPLIMLVTQIIPLPLTLALGIALCLLGLGVTKIRAALLLMGFAAIGHFVCMTLISLVAQWQGGGYFAVIIGRFSLVGYLAAFGLWMAISPPKHNYLKLGSSKAKIYFPLVWKGREEPMWRFILIFSGFCTAAILVLAFNVKILPQVIIAGVIFALVNSALEELLWRGLILPRAVDITDEKQGLVIAALAFGLYHISLGFPLWACAVFAVGGFYMGGSTVISKGLLPPFIMHVMVNMIFVFAGLIF